MTICPQQILLLVLYVSGPTSYADCVCTWYGNDLRFSSRTAETLVLILERFTPGRIVRWLFPWQGAVGKCGIAVAVAVKLR